MDKIVWYFRTASPIEIFGQLWLPLVIGIALYYSSYLPVLLRAFARKLRTRRHEPTRVDLPALLVVLPTLLRNRGELVGLERAIGSVLDNGYPGPLVVCAAIDDIAGAPHLVDELRRWTSTHAQRNVRLLVAGTSERGGKAMAIEAAADAVRAMVARGELDAFPPLFVNMDADSTLGDRALELLACQLLRRGRWSRQRPMIVASNVCIRRDHYWYGWRGLATVRGFLALQVAREYLTSISLARNNWRLLPVTAVSGALYCTWSELHLQAPRYGGFVQTLRFRDWARWWLGGGAPSFAQSTARPIPEATTGPGDDTWMSWLAMVARWQHGRISLELPPTPLHAFLYFLRSYLFRPIAYEPAAQVFTATPTTIRGLFRQRVRWNSSRVWLLNRFGWSLWFHWSAGAIVYLDALMLVGLHVGTIAALFLWPFADHAGQWLAILITFNLAYALVRAGSTLIAMVQDDDIRGQWEKLLAVPFSGPFHLVFNVLTAAVGIVQDVLLFGTNTGFAPETTLIRSGVGRIALLYRVRRAFLLAARSIVHGDVRLGWFWFGWNETPWTPNGYHGWTDGRRRAHVHAPRAIDAPERERRAIVRA
jgi:cellulose synthase/poly-beta-1,6-N-acetylglucosamine synthase-like glycosyltransferase